MARARAYQATYPRSQGIRIVWRAILEKGLDLPTVGQSADGLWNHILELGFEDPEVLKKIFIYARKLKEHQGRAWPKLYSTVLSRYLRTAPSRALLYHTRLHKYFPPSSQQFRQLLTLVLHDEQIRQIFLSMHKDFPHARVYDSAIPELCRQGLYATAVVWHKKLTKRGDMPSNAKVAEPVLHYLARVDEKTRLVEYSRLMVAAGVAQKPKRDQAAESPGLTQGEFMLRQVAEMSGIPNPEKKFSDGSMLVSLLREYSPSTTSSVLLNSLVLKKSGRWH